MRKRLWAAVGIGFLIGGAGVVGFAPYVRSRVTKKADRYGAEVAIQQVVPGWEGLHLKGVRATLKGVPGVSVSLEDVVVGWSDQRPRALVGTKVKAVGSLGELASDVAGWRKAYLGKKSAGGGSR